MCFSASASFGAGAILSAIGVASIKQVRSSTQLPFATIPLIFAVQQLTEGFLWLALREPSDIIIQSMTAYIFIFFAQVVWPTWVPFSILNIEQNEKRRKGLKVLLGIGLAVSLYLAYCLSAYHVQANIAGKHISYVQNYPPAPGIFVGILYILATVSPQFFSSVKRMWILSWSILVSYIMTWVFYEDYIVSVWCFFASIISISVYFIMRGMNKNAHPVNNPDAINHAFR